MNYFEQLRDFRGDIEVGRPPEALEVLRWAGDARPFCATCLAQPLYAMDGSSLSGRTRVKSLIARALERGVITSTTQVHCDDCPPAEPLVQLGVFELLLQLPQGSAWCLRYAHQQPGAVAASPGQKRGVEERYGIEWLDPTVCDWLEAHVARWGFTLEDWQLALAEVDGVIAARSAEDLVLLLADKRARVRWHPCVSVQLERMQSYNVALSRKLEALDRATGGQLVVDLLSSQDKASRVLGEVTSA